MLKAVPKPVLNVLIKEKTVAMIKRIVLSSAGSGSNCRAYSFWGSDGGLDKPKFQVIKPHEQQSSPQILINQIPAHISRPYYAETGISFLNQSDRKTSGFF